MYTRSVSQKTFCVVGATIETTIPWMKRALPAGSAAPRPTSPDNKAAFKKQRFEIVSSGTSDGNSNAIPMELDADAIMFDMDGERGDDDEEEQEEKDQS